MSLRALAQQVDERLAELYDAFNVLDRDKKHAEDEVRYAAGQDRNWRNGGTWSGTLAEALDASPEFPHMKDRHSRAVANYRRIKALQAHIDVEVSELQDCYADYFWTRAFLVENSNGHVHKTMDCSTCFPTTVFTWLPQYSGAEEDEIVEAAGQDACTVCYPSAPADILNRPSTIQTATRIEKAKAKAEREAAKAAREAKRKAAAPTASGEPLSLPSRYDAGRVEQIATERAAVIEWNSDQDNLSWYRNDESRLARYRERQSIIESALAEKHGVTPEEMRERLLTKYSKRRR